MSFAKAVYDAVFGTAWHVQGEQIKDLLTYTTYAGNPTNNLVPSYIGQQCFDTVNSDFYISVGTAAANWKKLTP